MCLVKHCHMDVCLFSKALSHGCVCVLVKQSHMDVCVF